jgi:hypothetical protein
MNGGRWMVVALVVGLGSPSASGEPAAAPASAAPLAAVGKKVSVSELRRRMEQDSAEIGKLAQKARRGGDVKKIACVTDKQDRAELLMDVASPELSLLRDRAADGKARVFASEKLAAASARLSGLLEEARACAGDPALGGAEGTENGLSESRTVQPRDPTSAAAHTPWLPPPDDPTRPPVASPVR